MKKVLLILISLAFVASSSYAQSNLLGKAQKLFDDHKYVKALDIFKQAFDEDQDINALMGIVDAYRKMGAISEAEGYLQQLANMPSSRPIYKYQLGQALLTNGKFKEAEFVFNEYADLVPSDSRGMKFATAASNYLTLAEPDALCEVRHLAINTPYDDFSPCMHEDGIVFASDRGGVKPDNIYEGTGRPHTDLYFSPNDGDYAHTTSSLFGGNLNSFLHEATCTHTRDGSTMYFTRNNYVGKKCRTNENEEVGMKIFTATPGDLDNWDIADELPFNSDDYNTMHPTLSKDGNALYFASDMPGGYGESDIYVSYRVGSSWGEPQNLGPEINSEGRDQFPFIADDGTLYFASDGHAGLGGLDIFKTVMDGGIWGYPNNMGAPLNSNADDFGMVINPETKMGYFTSRRAGGSGLDDIYSFRKNCLVLNGLVCDKDTKEPIATANVVVKDKNGKVVFEDMVDEDGTFTTCIANDNNYSIVATDNEYPDSGNASVSTVDFNGEEISAKVALFMPPPPPPPAPPVVVEEPQVVAQPCIVSGKVYDGATNRGVANARVTIQSSYGSNQETFSDSEGYYSFAIQEGTDYKLYATAPNYLTGSNNTSTVNRDCATLGSVDVRLDMIQLNQPIALEHIYYDLNKAFIREDAKPDLERVVTLMNENPCITVELSSHTDSRSSDSYNQSLSQRRAQAAVDYIVARGIDASRINAVGYGESQLVNECANGVTCSDSKHQENRRTEFRITDCDQNATFSVPKYFSGEVSSGTFYDVNQNNTSYSYSIDK